MDLDRSQFLLRSYLRIRLQKIEKYIFHILATAELYNRLSKQEKAFAKTCLVDLEKHLEESVLLKLSLFSNVPWQKKNEGRVEMAENSPGTILIGFLMQPMSLLFFIYIHVLVLHSKQSRGSLNKGASL